MTTQGEQIKTYMIELAIPGSGELKQFRKNTTWTAARAFVDLLQQEFDLDAIRLGVLEGDVIRELWTTGSVPSDTQEKEDV